VAICVQKIHVADHLSEVEYRYIKLMKQSGFKPFPAVHTILLRMRLSSNSTLCNALYE